MEKPLKPHAPLTITVHKEVLPWMSSKIASNNWDRLCRDAGFGVAPEPQVTKENEIERSQWLVFSDWHLNY